MKQIRALELAEWLADNNRPAPILLDVREAMELEICCLPAVKHIPMHLVPIHRDELPSDQDIVVICHHGARSMQVAQFLVHHGFEQVHNLTGGIEAWAIEVDPKMRRY